MNLNSFLQGVLGFTGVFNAHLVLFVIIICLVGEVAVAAPYVLETVWITAGYNLGSGAFSPVHVLLLWLAGQAGRQSGALSLSYLARLGTGPVMKIYNKYSDSTLSKKISASNSLPVRLFRKIDPLSPFSVAFGRMLGLRLPLTMTLGIKREPRVLFLGVLASSLVWDGIYIAIGMAGANATVSPAQMILYSLIGISALYGGTFAVQRLKRLVKRQPTTEL